ncbi:MAG: hypothetical protein UU21_C0014G0012 [Candidatus Levybacteria bacterium GW2011_GWA2_40_8]|nr:MAG: hypothetical protein UU21_C0014G0012 [Candidatus Levybacteria bacterium GW2011_GWA2_40_8]
MGAEQKPGKLEKLSYILRNAEATAAAVLAALGHFGAAGVMAIGAMLDHLTGKFFEKRRKRAATAA